MGEWQETTLETITEPNKEGWRPNQEDVRPYVGLEHIEQEKLRLISVGSSEQVISNKFAFESGDVLFGKLRPYFRKVVRPNFSGVCSTDIWVMRAKEGFDQTWLFYLMADWNFVNFANGGEGGSRMPRADWNFLRATVWNTPPLPEQQAIAEVLCSLDDKIDLLHRQNQTLEALAETLFRQWFIEEADPAWETVKVGSVAKTNLKTLKADYPYTQIQYLDTGSITKGKIESLQPYELKDAPSRAKRLVEHNDIIISTVRPNHKHYGFIKNPQQDLVVSTGFCVITGFGIDPHFMYSFMTQEEMTEYLSIVAEASTSTYPSLKPSDIEAIEFQFPPKDLLESIR